MNSEPESAHPHARFVGATYETFRGFAQDTTLSAHERIGYPDNYREGAETAIFSDIESKLPALASLGARVADIGCGAGQLARLVIGRCGERGHQLVLVDSPEMLALLPDASHMTKAPGRFPDSPDLFPGREGTFDAVIAYGVLQSVISEGPADPFIEAAVSLLAPGGRLLLGEISNASMRARFLASEAGRAHHREYSGRDEDPPIPAPQKGDFVDEGLLDILRSARHQGFHAWIVPQPTALPMGNRREDILIERP